jgi:hypothetical protein
LQRRHEPEQQAAANREQRGEREHATVERHFVQPRDVPRRDGANRSFERDGQEHTGCSAGDSEQVAFRQQLAHQSDAARADRRAPGQLPLPRGTSRKLEICHVRDRYQQHERDGNRQHDERGTNT